MHVPAESPAPLRLPDGCGLFLHHWPTSVRPVRGHVLIVHGLGEHGQRYADFAQDCVAAGWDVHSYDHRGHGRSDGPRGRLASTHSLLEDLGCVLARVRAGSALPLVLVAHSMGGLVAARYVAEGLQPKPSTWWQPVDGLILSSPALDSGLGPLARALVALGAWLLPGLQMSNQLRPEDFCRDPVLAKTYVTDPLMHDRISLALAHFINQAGPEVLQLAPRWATPTLLMWAGADRCVNPSGSATFAGRAPAAVVQAQAWPDLYHEILFEPERASVRAEILHWLQRFTAAASGTSTASTSNQSFGSR